MRFYCWGRGGFIGRHPSNPVEWGFVNHVFSPVERPARGGGGGRQRHAFYPESSTAAARAGAGGDAFFHYSKHTEEVYWHWIRRFLAFHRQGMNGTEGAWGIAEGQSPIAEEGGMRNR